MAIQQIVPPVNGKNVHINESQALIVVDLRTGNPYKIPIQHNAISATDLVQIKAPENKEYPADQDEHGLRVFDAGYQNTAVGHSAITYV